MFERVLAEADLWVGEMRGAELGGARVLIVRHETGVCAYQDRCPHQGYPLSEGELAGGIITCRVHRHTFDATNGHGINPLQPCLRSLPVRVEDGQVLVDVAPVGSAER